MKYTIVSIYDNGIGAFGRPAFVRSKNEAIRSFGDEVQRTGSDQLGNQMAQHPQDFQLFYVGAFDDDSGQFVNVPERPEKIADALAILQQRDAKK